MAASTGARVVDAEVPVAATHTYVSVVSAKSDGNASVGKQNTNMVVRRQTTVVSKAWRRSSTVRQTERFANKMGVLWSTSSSSLPLQGHNRVDDVNEERVSTCWFVFAMLGALACMLATTFAVA